MIRSRDKKADNSIHFLILYFLYIERLISFSMENEIQKQDIKIMTVLILGQTLSFTRRYSRKAGGEGVD